MLEGKELIGVPLVCTDGSEPFECVKGIVLDSSETHVTSLLVEQDDMHRSARVVSLHDVQAFRDTDVMVDSPESIHRVNLVPHIGLILHERGPALGTTLIDKNGVEIGTINNVLFDEATGEIDSFEVAKRSWTDLFFKHDELPLHEELEQGLIMHTAEVKELPSGATRPMSVRGSAQSVDELQSERAADDGMPSDGNGSSQMR